MDAAAVPVIIVQLSDLHVTAAGQRNHYGIDTNTAVARCLEHVRALPGTPALVVASGDLTDNGAREEYEQLRRLLAAGHAGHVDGRKS